MQIYLVISYISVGEVLIIFISLHLFIKSFQLCKTLNDI